MNCESAACCTWSALTPRDGGMSDFGAYFISASVDNSF